MKFQKTLTQKKQILSGAWELTPWQDHLCCRRNIPDWRAKPMARKTPAIIAEVQQTIPLKRIDPHFFQVQFQKNEADRFEMRIGYRLDPLSILFLSPQEATLQKLADCLRSRKETNPRIVIELLKDRVVAWKLQPEDLVEVATEFAMMAEVKLMKCVGKMLEGSRS